jgi:hypothetical protein
VVLSEGEGGSDRQEGRVGPLPLLAFGEHALKILQIDFQFGHEYWIIASSWPGFAV